MVVVGGLYCGVMVIVFCICNIVFVLGKLVEIYLFVVRYGWIFLFYCLLGNREDGWIWVFDCDGVWSLFFVVGFGVLMLLCLWGFMRWV